jgi:hypothetical protein
MRLTALPGKPMLALLIIVGGVAVIPLIDLKANYGVD